MVSIDDDPEILDGLRFTFVPTQVRRAQEPAVHTQSTPHEFVVSVQGHGDQTSFRWITPPESDKQREKFEAIARQRVTTRFNWLERLRKLVHKFEKWADDFEWSSRNVNKQMEDAEIGNYSAPSLLLQKESVRLFLEPVARTAPGADGLVDLYRMPAYDDIASLYYYNDDWNIHYPFGGSSGGGAIREGEAQPLSREFVKRVFNDLKTNAR